MGFEYDNNASSGERWIILNDTKQQVPSGFLKIEKIEERKTASGKGMPVLTLVDESNGDIYAVCAWARDVKECISSYGTKPEEWGPVKFVRKDSRFAIVPDPEWISGSRVKHETISR